VRRVESIEDNEFIIDGVPAIVPDEASARVEEFVGDL